LNIALKDVYVNLSQSFKNSSVNDTVKLIKETIKDKNLIGLWNFYHDKDNKPVYNMISFRTFLLFYIWVSFLGDFRKKIYKVKEDKKNKEECKFINSKKNRNKEKYAEPCRFVNAVTDLISFLSFESLSVSFNGHTQDELEADTKVFFEDDFTSETPALNNWYSFLCNVFQRSSKETWGKEFFKRRVNDLIRRDIEGAMYFQNIRVYPSYLDYCSAAITDKELSKDNLRWDTAWGILLGDILCTMAQTFITYNSKVEEHIKNGEKAKIMFDLLKKASFDFKNFYDADIVQKLELRNALEIAMETFLIKSHYDKLRERIKLFSDYEIEGNEQELNLLILIGGSVANILLASTLDFMLWVYHYHRIFSLAIPTEILLSSAFFFYYYLHQKRSGRLISYLRV
jgi:hypothetical protein